MFCTFISHYMLDVEFGIEKLRGYVYVYVYVCMSRGLHISYLIARW
jgi:hypothetical protein